MPEPRWLETARKYVGQKEVPGKESNPWLVSLWHKLKGAEVFKWLGADDSSAPWCGTFVAACFSESAIPIAKHWYRARDWLNWGVKLSAPTVGCVVVYERKGGGHVGFVVGQDQSANLMTLGGNQGDKVSIAPFSVARVLGYRWPENEVVSLRVLPVVKSDGSLSTNEA